MSEAPPAAVATSADARSKRPTKRRALSPTSQQASAVAQLLANPDRDIKIPTGSPKSRNLPPPPEIVANVQGSSAGAGSGEFHVYKASRRREYERLRLMDEEVRIEEETKEYNKKIEEMRKKDSEKTSKNRKKRMKKQGGKAGKKDEDMKGAEEHTEGNAGTTPTRPTGATSGPRSEDAGRKKDEQEQTAPVVEDCGVVIHDDDD